MIDPTESEPHLRRLGAGRPRPLARDRQRRHRSGSSPTRTSRASTSRRDGGATFTEVWNGNDAASFGVTDVGLDPLDPTTVYASAFDQGLWRRSPSLDGSASPTDFRQVFAPRFAAGGGRDRTMFAATVKNGKTRLYLTDGADNGGGIDGAIAAEFWRTDNANQPAATLLASQATGLTVPAGDGNPVPGHLQRLAAADVERRPRARTSRRSTSAPASAGTTRTSTRRAGDARHGLRDRLVHVRRAPVQHEGRRLRERPLERPSACSTRTPPATRMRRNNNRTFTDLTYDTQDQPRELVRAARASRHCLLRAPNAIHPDQHAIVVNPSNPTQIFEGSDGGVIRTDGDVRRHLVAVHDDPPAAQRRAARSRASGCCRGSRRGSTHINKNLEHAAVHQRRDQPVEVVRGHGRDAGQRHVVERPGCETNDVAADHLRRRRQRRLRRDEPDVAVQRVHERVQRLELRERRPDEVGDHLGADREQRRGRRLLLAAGRRPEPARRGAPDLLGRAARLADVGLRRRHARARCRRTRTPNIAFYEANCPEFTTFGGQARLR